MLRIAIGAAEAYDEANGFVEVGGVVVELEHSLVSLSKWEQTWEKPFLGPQEKTREETIDYIRCMAVNDDVTSEVLALLTDKNIMAINDYIDRKMTATWFKETNKPAAKEIITNEIIYHWLISLEINWEVQYWHLNRLLTLVRVQNEKNAPQKSGRTKGEIAKTNAQINAERRARFNTKG